jgi:hypothetical protein
MTPERVLLAILGPGGDYTTAVYGEEGGRLSMQSKFDKKGLAQEAPPSASVHAQPTSLPSDLRGDRACSCPAGFSWESDLVSKGG